MPATPIEFFQEKEGRSQVVTFLEHLKKNDLPAFAKCVAQIERLEEMGHELRRPTADFLRDGIYELRASKGSVNYRLLYFFHNRTAAVVAIGLTKEGRVPPKEIDRAIAWKELYMANPEQHRVKGRENVMEADL